MVTEHQRVGRIHQADSAMSKCHAACATLACNDGVIDVQICKFAWRFAASESHEWHFAFQQVFNPGIVSTRAAEKHAIDLLHFNKEFQHSHFVFSASC